MWWDRIEITGERGSEVWLCWLVGVLDLEKTDGDETRDEIFRYFILFWMYVCIREMNVSRRYSARAHMVGLMGLTWGNILIMHETIVKAGSCSFLGEL